MDTRKILHTQIQAASYAEVTTRTIRNWVRAGMPLTEQGFYSTDQLDEWQAKHGRKSAAEKQARIPEQLQSIAQSLREIAAKLERLA